MIEQYTKTILSTFDKPDEIKVNGQLLINAIVLFTSAATLLNEVNKKTFRKERYDRDALAQAFEQAQQAIHELNGTHIREEIDQYNVDPQALHAILGIGSTAGELADALLNVMLTSHNFDISYNVQNEVGDILKFQTLLLDAVNGDWDYVMQSSAHRELIEQQTKE